MSLAHAQPASISPAAIDPLMQRRAGHVDHVSSPSAASLFGARLDQAKTAGQGDQNQLKELTEMLVSTAFIMPMFEKMRQDPLAAKLFHGGRGEEIFQQQFDQVISDRIAGASNFGLADAIYNQLSRGKTTGETIDTHG